MNKDIQQIGDNFYKKCRVVMLPASNTDTLIWKEHWEDGSIFYDPSYKDDCIPQHLYILSDEEIKEGDWCIDPEVCELFQCKQNLSHEDVYIDTNDKIRYTHCDPHEVYKIITSTNPELNLPRPSDAFLKAYCEKGGVNGVLVEYKYETITTGSDEFNLSEEDQLMLKVASDNTITIKPIRSSWSREEVIKLLKEAKSSIREHTGVDNCGCCCYCSLDFDKWIEQNL